MPINENMVQEITAYRKEDVHGSERKNNYLHP